MNKKSFTTIFTILSTLFNILFTGIIIAALMVVSTVILNKVVHLKTGQVYMIVWMFCFLGGLVLGMFLFGKISTKIIEKYNLEEKLDPKIIGKHLPTGKRNKAYHDEDMKKPQTVMPDSVKEEGDPWEQDNSSKTE